MEVDSILSNGKLIKLHTNNGGIRKLSILSLIRNEGIKISPIFHAKFRLKIAEFY
jgi:hypothetical protein